MTWVSGVRIDCVWGGVGAAGDIPRAHRRRKGCGEHLVALTPFC